MTVCFLAQETEQATLAYRPAHEQPFSELPMTSRVIPQTSWRVWQGALGPLRPEMRYEYRIRYRSGTTETERAPQWFTTLPKKTKSIKAAFFNDLHSRPETLKTLMDYVRPEDYQFSVLMGDCWQDPSPTQEGEAVFSVLNAYVNLLNAGEKPMLYLRGNHDVRGGFAPSMAYLFDLPGLDPKAELAEQAYQFGLTAGPVRFIALDTGEDFEKRFELFQPMRQRQADWLKAVLKEEPCAWQVLVTHQPLYNDNIWYSEASRQVWEPVLAGAGIDLALAGHDHGWKLLPAGSRYEVTLKADDANQHKGTAGTHVLQPPYPVLIGGGPSVKESTVMLLTADEKRLSIRLLTGTDGSILKEISLSK